MMISRRPNRRASSDRAPGPRKTMAMAITTTKTVGRFASNKFGVAAGNDEIDRITVANPTITPATGVRKPINSALPLAIASKLTVHVASVGLSRPK